MVKVSSPEKRGILGYIYRKYPVFWGKIASERLAIGLFLTVHRARTGQALNIDEMVSESQYLIDHFRLNNSPKNCITVLFYSVSFMFIHAEMSAFSRRESLLNDLLQKTMSIESQFIEYWRDSPKYFSLLHSLKSILFIYILQMRKRRRIALADDQAMRQLIRDVTSVLRWQKMPENKLSKGHRNLCAMLALLARGIACKELYEASADKKSSRHLIEQAAADIQDTLKLPAPHFFSQFRHPLELISFGVAIQIGDIYDDISYSENVYDVLKSKRFLGKKKKNKRPDFYFLLSAVAFRIGKKVQNREMIAESESTLLDLLNRRDLATKMRNQVSNSLAILRFDGSRWADAVKVAHTVLKDPQFAIGRHLDPSSFSSEVRQLRGLGDMAAYAHARLGQPALSLLCAEAGRSIGWKHLRGNWADWNDIKYKFLSEEVRFDGRLDCTVNVSITVTAKGFCWMIFGAKDNRSFFHSYWSESCNSVSPGRDLQPADPRPDELHRALIPFTNLDIETEML